MAAKALVPEGRHSPVATTVGSKLYMFRGVLGDRSAKHRPSDEENNMMYIYDVIERQWTKRATTGSFPTACSESACTSFGEKIYTFGGFTDNQEYTSETHEFCVHTLVWKKLEQTNSSEGPMRKCSSGMVAFYRDSDERLQLWVFGGYGVKGGDGKPNPGARFVLAKDRNKGRTNELHILHVSDGMQMQLKVAISAFSLHSECVEALVLYFY